MALSLGGGMFSFEHMCQNIAFGDSRKLLFEKSTIEPADGGQQLLLRDFLEENLQLQRERLLQR